VGDEVLAVNGEQPRDVIRWTWLTDDADPVLEVRRGGLEHTVAVAKRAGEKLGIDVHSALFDQLRTCDNHCEFCFIYQLPPGLRKSLYLKDDDYRLSFLYGNFTTLTRFTELDLERVVTEGLGPLNVSIHATDPDARNELLRNRRGGPSLRWLRALLDHGVEVHGQVVCCPGLNDAAVLEETLAGVLDRFPELASLCVVPLGVSRYNHELRMRATTPAEAAAVLDTVHAWQEIFLAELGHRLVFAGDEYYLLAGRPFPPADHYEGFAMHEDGVGMARAFEQEFRGLSTDTTRPVAGFFAWADGTEAAGPPPGSVGGRYEAAGDYGAPPDGYRPVRTAPADESDATRSTPVAIRPRADAPVGILTGEAGAAVLAPLLEELGRADVRIVPVHNGFFGGTTSVTGLLVGADLARTLAGEPDGHRYLLPDVCLSGNRFLDGTTAADLPRPVEIIPTDGAALRRALEPSRP
jgi:NifB/MoaA-like Fe-S oxidoreductase